MLHYNGFTIRPIQLEDNIQICNVIKGVFYELGLPLVGTAYADKDTLSMYKAYQDEIHRKLAQSNQVFTVA